MMTKIIVLGKREVYLSIILNLSAARKNIIPDIYKGERTYKLIFFKWLIFRILYINWKGTLRHYN